MCIERSSTFIYQADSDKWLSFTRWSQPSFEQASLKLRASPVAQPIKEFACNARDTEDAGSIPGWG